MNKIFSPYLVTIIVLFLCLAPQNIFAAELSFKAIPNKIGDETTIVEVRIDPQAKELNVVEGTILFSGTATDNFSVQVENGNSILPLWPTPPQYIANEKAIHFTGGVPDGFNKEGLLFILRLTSPEVGDVNISYSDGYAYLNDGNGTKENIFSEPLQINFNQSSDNDIKNNNLFLNQNKYVILALVVIVLGFFVFYGYKKITKK